MCVSSGNSFYEGLFNDKRLVLRANNILKSLSNKGKAIANRFCHNKAEERGTSRFMRNTNVDIADLKEASYRHCRINSSGKRVLAIQDTSVIDYSSHSGRLLPSDPDIGPIGDHNGIGYLLHPTLVIDRDKGFPVGFSNIHEWNRTPGSPKKTITETIKQPLESKESYRWVECANQSKKVLSEAEEITVIADRESDIFEQLALVPDEKTHLLIRSNHNRSLYDRPEKLLEYLSSLPVIGTTSIMIKNSRTRVSRNAEMELKYGSVKISRPGYKKSVNLPDYVELNVIEVKETNASVPEKETPIHWRLLTTHTLNTQDEILEIINCYAMRWWIEELFRVLKKQGLELETSCFETGKALKKLGIIAMQAALQIMQLKAGRDGHCDVSPEIIFTEDELAFQEALLGEIAGRTKAQSNPYPRDNLAWSAWIIARLGGWKNSKTSPPGHITMARGLECFNQRFAGWIMAMQTFKGKKDVSGK